MEDEPINQNYLIGCDTIEHSPSLCLLCAAHLHSVHMDDIVKLAFAI